ncbi:hypothetical protein [Bradyrhizobium sp. 142]|uniref:hypothetical protein n=1 Tax=Bradyrhizobium sp. 142 TaxID=2782618 RepID=UPI001FF71CEA|nr:hypothetical protein [Bradyrhizobium sp. 142]MCK1726281.1 hypothetical protein [Bradyrhizobium sp. 142]
MGRDNVRPASLEMFLRVRVTAMFDDVPPLRTTTVRGEVAILHYTEIKIEPLSSTFLNRGSAMS